MIIFEIVKLQELIVMLLFCWWLSTFVHKILGLDRMDGWLMQKIHGLKDGSLKNFLNSLLACTFCMESHMCFWGVGVPCLIATGNVSYLACSIAGAGFNNLINRVIA